MADSRLHAPVQLSGLYGDATSHSLAVLSTVYHYNHWIFDNIRDYLGNTVVEVGSGVGNISQFLLNAEKLVCLNVLEHIEDDVAALITMRDLLAVGRRAAQR